MSDQQNTRVHVEALGHKVSEITIQNQQAFGNETEPSKATESTESPLHDVSKPSICSKSPDEVELEEPRTPLSISSPPSASPAAHAPKTDTDLENKQTDDEEIATLLATKAPFIHCIGPCTYEISPGHVKGQRTSAKFFASLPLLRLVVDELTAGGGGAVTAAA